MKANALLEEREKAAKRIRLVLAGIARQLCMTGEVQAFGSFSNGFTTGTSDLDVVFLGTTGTDNTISVLGKFASLAADLGFENVTKIFSASVPLVKFTDVKSQMEVDFCINNELGVRNSLLLQSYSRCDNRVLLLGRLVKDWAKKHELVGTADGYLNSYAYMLLVIHFLQSVQPLVVPNLQASATEPYPVTDNKWGCEDCWETKFDNQVEAIPKSQNTMSLGELMLRFFHFYTRVFDWRSHAVCMRLNRSGVAVDKYSLTLPTNDEQWYVEDPFDLKHNLAGKCSRACRKRILDEMNESLQELSTSGKWEKACPSNRQEYFFLKCRVSQGVTPQALLEEFEEYDLLKLHFPKQEGNARMGQAFLEFADSMARRRAHCKNEKYIADCQLQLHYSTQHSLAEAVAQCNFSTYEMASYKMQRQVLAARVQSIAANASSRQEQAARQASQMSGFQEHHDVTPFQFYGQRGAMGIPPPPPAQQQPPGLGPSMWDPSQMKVQDLHQLHMMQMQAKALPPRRPQAAEMAAAYAKHSQAQSQWMQAQALSNDQQRQLQMHRQQLDDEKSKAEKDLAPSMKKANAIQIVKVVPAVRKASVTVSDDGGAGGWLDLTIRTVVGASQNSSY